MCLVCLQHTEHYLALNNHNIKIMTYILCKQTTKYNHKHIMKWFQIGQNATNCQNTTRILTIIIIGSPVLTRERFHCTDIFASILLRNLTILRLRKLNRAPKSPPITPNSAAGINAKIFTEIPFVTYKKLNQL